MRPGRLALHLAVLLTATLLSPVVLPAAPVAADEARRHGAAELFRDFAWSESLSRFDYVGGTYTVP